MRCIKSVVMPNGDTFTLGRVYGIHYMDDVERFISLFSDQNGVCVFWKEQFMNGYLVDEFFESLSELRIGRLNKLGI